MREQDGQRPYYEITLKPYSPREHCSGQPSSDDAPVRKRKRRRWPWIGLSVLLMAVVLFGFVRLFHTVSIVVTPSAAKVDFSGNFPNQWPVFDGGKGAGTVTYTMMAGAYDAVVSAPDYYPRNVRFIIAGDQVISVTLDPMPGNVEVLVTPEVRAQAFLNAKPAEPVPGVLRNIPADEHTLTLLAKGYRRFEQVFTAVGLNKTTTLQVSLTKEEKKVAPSESSKPSMPQRGKSKTKKAKQAVAKPGKSFRSRTELESAWGLSFVRFQPRNEQVVYEKGRRAHTVTLLRPFAIGKTEVTNKQFKRFMPGHSSGQFQGQSLDGPEQPVVNISWTQAALFANWLSKQAGITPFYIAGNNKITGFNKVSSGYRLVTEAEWVSAVRGVVPRTYPWGGRFDAVPEKAGNYADQSAAQWLAMTMQGYNDGYGVSAPVGQFYANSNGIYDMGGNAAEWLHDVFAVFPDKETTNPLGMRTGGSHVIRGGSWKYATRRMLSVNYRQYHPTSQHKPEVGFRLAYYWTP